MSSHEDCTYLFGSAIWRLPLNEFDETQNDLDFLINEKNISIVNNCITKLCDSLEIELEFCDPVTCEKSYNGRSKHIPVILNHTFKIDLVYVESMVTFISKMSG